VIRPARPADAESIRAVERAAGRRFAEIGMSTVADDEPMAADRLVRYAAEGRSWVAESDGGDVAGYVVVEAIDGCAHVEQLSVRPEHQGRGLGRRLLEEVDGWARREGLAALTLTTFGDVPWNRPLYEHLGFRCLDEVELSPGLLAVREAEAALGLDPSDRVVMRRDL
jgi:GNAT superfamily N-acetyltransferase